MEHQHQHEQRHHEDDHLDPDFDDEDEDDDDDDGFDLDGLIDGGHWRRIPRRLRTHPEEADHDDVLRQTPLHRLCGVSSHQLRRTSVASYLIAVRSLVERSSVASLFETDEEGRTPLHLACASASPWHGEVVDRLLERAGPAASALASARTRHLANTALHETCRWWERDGDGDGEAEERALLRIVESLTRAEPSCGRALNRAGASPAWSLYGRRTTTAMDRDEREARWRATATLLLRAAGNADGDPSGDGVSCSLLHASLTADRSWQPAIANEVLARRGAARACRATATPDGRLPPTTHDQRHDDDRYVLPVVLVVRATLGRRARRSLLRTLIDGYPAAARRPVDGDTLLACALRNDVTWEDGSDLIWRAWPDALRTRERTTRLWPFAFAASRVATDDDEARDRDRLDTIYRLLREAPDLVAADGVRTRATTKTTTTTARVAACLIAACLVAGRAAIAITATTTTTTTIVASLPPRMNEVARPLEHPLARRATNLSFAPRRPRVPRTGENSRRVP